jgi:hypothetical protein
METTTDVAPSGDAPTDIVQIPGPAAAAISARDAARSIASFRWKQREGGEEAQNDSVNAASPTPSETPGEESQGAPSPENAQSPTTAEAEPLETPAAEAPIEPPRSWTKEARERFASLPRETQEYLASREQERDREVRRVQNESAEERRALEAERERVAQARVQYENALPSVRDQLLQQRLGEFADIQSVHDIERLAREDWPRYMQWDALQKRIASNDQELSTATARQEQEREIALDQLIAREQGRFREKAPDAVEPANRAKLEAAAISMLHDLGFTQKELTDLYNGLATLSVHDHRLQLLMREGVRFRDAQKAAKEASAKPVPPVQRPGVAKDKGAAQDAVVQNLTKRLDQTGSLKDAARLIAERRKAR